MIKKGFYALIAILIASIAIFLSGCSDHSYLPFEITVDGLQVSYYENHQISVAANDKYEYAYIYVSPFYSSNDKYGIELGTNANPDNRINIQIHFDSELCDIDNVTVTVNGQNAQGTGELFDYEGLKYTDYYYSLPDSLKGVTKFEINISGLHLIKS